MPLTYFFLIPVVTPPKPECLVDEDCPSQKACSDARRCVNPCYDQNPCSSAQECIVIDSLPTRTVACKCADGYIVGDNHNCVPGKLETNE